MIEMVERWGEHVEESQGNACSDGHTFVIASPILNSSTSKDNAYSAHHDRARAANAQCSALLKPSICRINLRQASNRCVTLSLSLCRQC